VLKSAKRPLIILGKGAAYAQADDAIRAFVEKSGIPYLPMSMAKGCCQTTTPSRRARRARWCSRNRTWSC
jgi:oxalyl-CoA decarboxylase